MLPLYIYMYFDITNLICMYFADFLQKKKTKKKSMKVSQVLPILSSVDFAIDVTCLQRLEFLIIPTCLEIWYWLQSKWSYWTMEMAQRRDYTTLPDVGQMVLYHFNFIQNSVSCKQSNSQSQINCNGTTVHWASANSDQKYKKRYASNNVQEYSISDQLFHSVVARSGNGWARNDRH